MKCRQCGTEIADRALICYRCGTATTEAKFKAPGASAGGSSRTRMLVIVVIAVLLALLGFVALSGKLTAAVGFDPIDGSVVSRQTFEQSVNHGKHGTARCPTEN